MRIGSEDHLNLSGTSHSGLDHVSEFMRLDLFHVAASGLFGFCKFCKLIVSFCSCEAASNRLIHKDQRSPLIQTVD